MMELSSLESKSSQDFFLSHDKKISQLSPTLSPIGDKAFNIFQIKKVDSKRNGISLFVGVLDKLYDHVYFFANTSSGAKKN